MQLEELLDKLKEKKPKQNMILQLKKTCNGREFRVLSIMLQSKRNSENAENICINDERWHWETRSDIAK